MNDSSKLTTENSVTINLDWSKPSLKRLSLKDAENGFDYSVQDGPYSAS